MWEIDRHRQFFLSRRNAPTPLLPKKIPWNALWWHALCPSPPAQGGHAKNLGEGDFGVAGMWGDDKRWWCTTFRHKAKRQTSYPARVSEPFLSPPHNTANDVAHWILEHPTRCRLVFSPDKYYVVGR